MTYYDLTKENEPSVQDEIYLLRSSIEDTNNILIGLIMGERL